MKTIVEMGNYAFGVVSGKVHEALNAFTRIELSLALPADKSGRRSPKVSDLVLKPLTLTLTGPSADPSQGDISHVFKGLVTHASSLGPLRPDVEGFEIVAHSTAWTLAQGVASRVLRPSSLDAIGMKDARLTHMTAVLWMLTKNQWRENLEYAISLTRAPQNYAALQQIAQYQESDWNFIARLCEYEGVNHYFNTTQSDQEQLVITDSRYPFCYSSIENSKINFVEPSGMVHNERQVFEFFLGARRTVGAVRVSKHSSLEPSLLFDAKRKTPGGGVGLLALSNQNPYDQTEAERLATVRAQEQAARRAFAAGKSDCHLFAAGHRFTLANHPAEKNNGQYLLKSVVHKFEQSVLAALKTGGDQAQYVNSFQAAPHKVEAPAAHRPERKTRMPRISGIKTAVVEKPASEKWAHFDDLTRYRLRFDFDQETHDEADGSRWTPLLRPYAQQADGKSWAGFHFPIQAQSKAAVAFMDGDPDRPVILGAVPTHDTPPPIEKLGSIPHQISSNYNVFTMYDPASDESAWNSVNNLFESDGDTPTDARPGPAVCFGAAPVSVTVNYGDAEICSFNVTRLDDEQAVAKTCVDKINAADSDLTASVDGSNDAQVNVNDPNAKHQTYAVQIDAGYGLSKQITQSANSSSAQIVFSRANFSTTITVNLGNGCSISYSINQGYDLDMIAQRCKDGISRGRCSDRSKSPPFSATKAASPAGVVLLWYNSGEASKLTVSASFAPETKGLSASINDRYVSGSSTPGYLDFYSETNQSAIHYGDLGTVGQNTFSSKRQTRLPPNAAKNAYVEKTGIGLYACGSVQEGDGLGNCKSWREMLLGEMSGTSRTQDGLHIISDVRDASDFTSVYAAAGLLGDDGGNSLVGMIMQAIKRAGTSDKRSSVFMGDFKGKKLFSSDAPTGVCGMNAWTDYGNGYFMLGNSQTPTVFGALKKDRHKFELSTDGSLVFHGQEAAYLNSFGCTSKGGTKAAAVIEWIIDGIIVAAMTFAEAKLMSEAWKSGGSKLWIIWGGLKVLIGVIDLVWDLFKWALPTHHVGLYAPGGLNIYSRTNVAAFSFPGTAMKSLLQVGGYSGGNAGLYGWILGAGASSYFGNASLRSYGGDIDVRSAWPGVEVEGGAGTHLQSQSSSRKTNIDLTHELSIKSGDDHIFQLDKDSVAVDVGLGIAFVSMGDLSCSGNLTVQAGVTVQRAEEEINLGVDDAEVSDDESLFNISSSTPFEISSTSEEAVSLGDK